MYLTAWLVVAISVTAAANLKQNIIITQHNYGYIFIPHNTFEIWIISISLTLFSISWLSFLTFRLKVIYSMLALARTADAFTLPILTTPIPPTVVPLLPNFDNINKFFSNILPIELLLIIIISVSLFVLLCWKIKQYFSPIAESHIYIDIGYKNTFQRIFLTSLRYNEILLTNTSSFLQIQHGNIFQPKLHLQLCMQIMNTLLQAPVVIPEYLTLWPSVSKAIQNIIQHDDYYLLCIISNSKNETASVLSLDHINRTSRLFEIESGMVSVSTQTLHVIVYIYH